MVKFGKFRKVESNVSVDTETSRQKIISDEEIVALTNKFIEVRDALHAFEAWSPDQLISPEEIDKLKKFPTGRKLEYLIRVACQVEHGLEHLRGKRKK